MAPFPSSTERRGRVAHRVTFRAGQPADDAIVLRAHVADRTERLGALGWPADALARLCAQQHALQERHIAAHHPRAERRTIVADREPVGRLCVDRTTAPWRIVDVAIVPEAQGRGIGTAAIGALCREAAAAGSAVDLHVGRDNPRAAALYRRLGFAEAIGASGSHARMVWSPPVAARVS